MDSISTEQAAQNLDNLIATSRMTRQEHIVLQQSLSILHNKAVKFDEPEVTDEALKEVEEKTVKGDEE